MKLFEVENRSPKWLILENKQGKDFHVEHLEDLIFKQGFNGAKKAFNYIENLRRMFATGQGKIGRTKVKWDGSLSIVCGTDPADGRFFIGTDQALQLPDAACKSSSDIDKFYGDDDILAKQLKLCFRYLSSLEIGKVIQGKLLFTADDILISNTNGKQMYTFTPNNTTYTVVVDSDLGNKISQSKLGIFFHTTYEGNNLTEMSPTYETNISGIKQTKNVWMSDETYRDYTGIASLTPEENAKILVGLRKSASTITKIDPIKFNSIINNIDFSTYMKLFIHDKMRDRQLIIDPMRLLKDFIEYYKEKNLEVSTADPEASAKSTEKIEKFIGDNLNAILGVFSVYKKIIELKVLILDKIKQIESTGVFVKENDGYKVNSAEGYVAVGNDRGIVRLINRIEYSES
jgi:hypothetical protein